MESTDDKWRIGAEYQRALKGVRRSWPIGKSRLLGRHLSNIFADTRERSNPDFEAVRNRELRALPGTVENRNLHGHRIRGGRIDKSYGGLPVWIDRERHLELPRGLDRCDLCTR